jgi:hypothetical protein
MRNTKALFLLPIFLAATAWADETTDRASIDRTIAALNDPDQRGSLFDKGADPVFEIARLANAFPFLLQPPMGGPDAPPSDTHLTVIISHEPWGEATIVPAPVGIEPAVPRVTSGPIQFLSPDVALVEGTARPAGRIVSTPVIFVMLREDGFWKIGSLRVLKPETAASTPSRDPR